MPVAFGGLSDKFSKNSWGSGVLLMYISVIAYLVEGMTRLVEDSSLLYDSLLWVKNISVFLEFKEKQTDGTLEFKGDFKNSSWSMFRLRILFQRWKCYMI